MTTSPLFLCFTYEYLSAAMFAGQPTTLQRLGVDEFKMQIPLFFEIKSSSQVYPIRKFLYDNPQGRTVYGNIFRAIENNEEYKLHGKGFPIINILSDIIQAICEKYRANQDVITTTEIETVLILPFDLSEKANEKLQKFLKENCGLKLITIKNLPEIVLPKEQLYLLSLGEQRLWFLYFEKNGLVEPKKLEIQQSVMVRKIADLVVNRAKKNSSTNISEEEKEKEIIRQESEVPLWIAETKQKGTCSITINFRDSYSGLDLLTREDIDNVSLDNTFILNRISQLDAINSFKKIVLVGQHLDNLVLQTLLRNEFGAARVAFLQDHEIIEESFFIIFGQWQVKQKQTALKNLQTKIIKLVNEQNGELTKIQNEELLQEAQQYKLSSSEIQTFIEAECEKIVFLDFEEIGETTLTTLYKVRHRRFGFVLMKVLKENYSKHAESKARIRNEFDWLKGKMAHANIAAVIPDTDNSFADNLVYYLSEYLKGTPLSQMSLPLQDHKTIQKYALQLLAALQQIHQIQWYHARLNDKHIFIETVANQQVIKLTNSKIEYAGAAQIEAKQQQNIKEFGIILLQLLTGKSQPQAISQLNEVDSFQSQWKPIIQRTSGGSSGNPYKNVAEMIRDIEQLNFNPPPKPPIKIPYRKIMLGLAVVAVIFGIFKVSKPLMAKVNELVEKIQPAKKADCQHFKQIFTGTISQTGQADMVVSLNIFSIEAKDADVCLLNYTLRMDTPEKKPYYERNKTAEVFTGQKKIVFDGALGKVTYSWVHGKMVLKSESFAELELK
jgi:hypothetical protein